MIRRENMHFSGSERVAIKWIELPSEIKAWADQNSEMIHRIQTALADTYHQMTDEQLWKVIAENASSEWQTAEANLSRSKEKLDDLNSPAKRSLGAIGQALDSHERVPVEREHDQTLSYFTIVNEGLRQRPDLQKLLEVLQVQKRMLERSTTVTESVQVAVEETPTIKATSPSPNRIAAMFKTQASKLMRPKAMAIVADVPGTLV